jgi:hypothetical protein
MTPPAAVNNAVPASLFRAWNYGLAGFDRTHIVKINWLWDVPKWNGGFAPARAMVNGWHVLGIATFSISLFKDFAIHERLRLQLRSEFYNFFNHTQYERDGAV